MEEFVGVILVLLKDAVTSNEYKAGRSAVTSCVLPALTAFKVKQLEREVGNV